MAAVRGPALTVVDRPRVLPDCSPRAVETGREKVSPFLFLWISIGKVGNVLFRPLEPEKYLSGSKTRVRLFLKK